MIKSALNSKSILSCALFVLLIFTGYVEISAQNPFAQEDPFSESTPTDDVDDNSTSVADGEAPPPNLAYTESTQLIIRVLNQSNPTTTEQLAQSVRTLLDVEAYDEANFYLGKLISAKPTDAQLYDLQLSVGPDFILNLRSNPNVQPLGTQVAEMIVEASSRAAYSPDRFGKLIKTLSNENVSIRSEAFRALKRLGAPAASKLINVFADESRQKEFVYIRSALKHFGDSAVEPLVGGARANNLQVMVESVRALGNYDSLDARYAMFRAYLSPKFPTSVRHIALDTITTVYKMPADRNQAEKMLADHAEDYLLGRRKLPGSETDLVTVWEWNRDTKKLEPRTVSKLTAERITAANRAADLFEIQPGEKRNRELYLISQLEALKRQAGSRKKINVKQLLAQYGAADAYEVQEVLVKAMELDLVPAAIGACEVLAEIGAPSMLSTGNTRLSPLVNAILYGNRHLQYAALDAIDSINPVTAFPGSSYVASLAVYLARSQGNGGGLAGNHRVSVAQTYAAALSQSGLYGEGVNTSREFFKVATTNPDLELLLVGDSLRRPDYVELVQQLRRDWRTKRIPIGVIVSDKSVGARVNRIIRNDPFMLVLPAVPEGPTFGTHILRLRNLAKPWPVSNDDRRSHALLAVRWLAKVASNRDTYAFWELGSHQEELTRLLSVPGFTKYAAQILSGVGTPLAQRELVNYASQDGLAFEDRQHLADAFIRSVEKSGSLLTSSEIRLQYDRYNASESQPKSTQELLGRILDAIEAKQTSRQ